MAKQLAARLATPEYQIHIQWAIHNSDAGGSVDCPSSYLASGNAGVAECIVSGGRACVMGFAITAAKSNDDNTAFNLTLLTQCQNSEAYGVLVAAGPVTIGNYLRSL